MVESIQITLANSEQTRKCGASLAVTLYRRPLDIALMGNLGAGKTTFLQGFAQALGIQEVITSPTYALEQRYRTSDRTEFIHLDLYRLESAEAAKILRQSDDHQGIRCIEWADRVPASTNESDMLRIQLEEEGDHRHLICTFEDTPLPSRTTIEEWRALVRAPAHITEHCEAVADVAAQVADALIADGRLVRKHVLVAAALVHDLFRFVDFRSQALPPGIQEPTAEQTKTWEYWKQKYPQAPHEMACPLFLREHGYQAVAEIVETHGLHHFPALHRTIEQKILFYADKRVRHDQIVSLEERFTDIANRYADGKPNDKNRMWLEESQKIERSLFPNRVPLLS